MMLSIEVTPDERDVILKMREWKDGVPDSAIGYGRESAVYYSLMSARAELYIMALRHGHNNLLERHERFHKLVSAHEVIRLVRAWEDLQERIRDDEDSEAAE